MTAGRTSRTQPKYWSQHVTERSNALDLESGVFMWSSPRAIARSLKRSAELSTRRKAGTYQSAISMLTFYINRAGGNLSRERRREMSGSGTIVRYAVALAALLGQPVRIINARQSAASQGCALST